MSSLLRAAIENLVEQVPGYRAAGNEKRPDGAAQDDNDDDDVNHEPASVGTVTRAGLARGGSTGLCGAVPGVAIAVAGATLPV